MVVNEEKHSRFLTSIRTSNETIEFKGMKNRTDKGYLTAEK
jgi:hypothetical protein